MLRMSSSTSPSSDWIVGSAYPVDSAIWRRSASVVAMAYPPLAIFLNLSAPPRDTLKADGVSSSRMNRPSLTLTTLGDLRAEPEEPFEERLGGRGAARHIHIDRHDRVDALERRAAVPELAARRRAVAHGDDPLRLGHLLVQPTEPGRHLVGHGSRDDHDVGLPRARPKDLHTEPGGVVVRHGRGHHLDGAARESIAERPWGARSGPVHEVAHRRENDVVVVREDARGRTRRIRAPETGLGGDRSPLDHVLLEVDGPCGDLFVDRHRFQSIEFCALCTAFLSNRVSGSWIAAAAATMFGRPGCEGRSSLTRPPASRTSSAPAIQSHGWSTDSK